MAPKSTFLNPGTRTDTFAREPYPVSNRENMGRIQWNADAEQIKWIQDHISKLSKDPSDNPAK
jgi:hypothetical protein